MLLGISGHFGSGKDEIARYLVDKHAFVRRALADALKEEVGTKLEKTLQAYAAEKWPGAEWSKTLLHDMLYVSKPPVVRALLQEFGTEVRRADNDYYWIERWFEWYDMNRHVNIVVPDVRHYNEVQMVRQQSDGSVIRVVRPGYMGDSHISERALDGYKDWDWVFHNDGSLDELYAQVEDWLALRH